MNPLTALGVHTRYILDFATCFAQWIQLTHHAGHGLCLLSIAGPGAGWILDEWREASSLRSGSHLSSCTHPRSWLSVRETTRPWSLMMLPNQDTTDRFAAEHDSLLVVPADP